ncbi:MAG: hypothetical protein P4L82_08540 [Ancalomicrobiaceae bacterium]|nr:hypothetical protein [Ancalomicrobiaceae bacterium]
MSQLMAWASAGLMALGLNSCTGEDPVGYVEITRTFPQTSSRDTFRINGAEVAGLNSADPMAKVVVSQKVGKVVIELYRGEALHWQLCAFDVARNRLVTATIYLQNRDIRCSVQS